MSYFYSIKTEGPDNDNVVRRHNMALNNYLKYGWASDVLQPEATPLTKEKDVHHMSHATSVKNNNLVMTTVLCCEDEEYEKAD